MESVNIVFLDRDGTLNRDAGYTCRPEDMVPYDCAAPAIALLQKSGFRTVVVTNQSAIGRGLATSEEVEATNNALRNLLLQAQPEAHLDYFCYCPHHPDDSCLCRKPLTGMITNPEFPWTFQSKDCWMIGDKTTDIEFGLALGIPADQCLLVLTGDGQKEQEKIKKKNVKEKVNIGIFADVLEAGIHIQEKTKNQ